MKEIYREQADPEILKECEEFVKEYKDITNDNEVGLEAIRKENKLLKSLANCDGLKDLLNDIRELSKKINNTDDYFEKLQYCHEMDVINSRLRIDAHANKILDDLDEIKYKNCYFLAKVK